LPRASVFDARGEEFSMRRLVAILAVLAITVLDLGSAHGGPPPGVTTKFFQGLPGVEADLCIDGVEVASSVQYEATVDGPSYAADTDPPYEEHTFEIRESAEGSCTGPILSGNAFGVFNRDEVILIAHALRQGSPGDEVTYVSRRPRVREGRTLFTIQHLAAAPKVSVTIDGHPLIRIEAGPRGGSSYIFNQFAAGRHTFVFKTPGTHEVFEVARLWMAEGKRWHLFLYGEPSSGYGVGTFSRRVGVR
jgi:hypothetical protein